MRIKAFLFCLLSVLSISSCKKSDSQPEEKKEVDVYVTGAALNNGKANAAYWKNGKIIFLNSGNPAYSSASGIAVKGNDVYVSGTLIINDQPSACYWKNGILHNLEGNDQRSETEAIAIKGEDIYVVGYIFDPVAVRQVATCWKNGLKTNLTPTTSGYSYVNGIVISGNDIYISGGNGKAVFWKNGVMNDLPFLSNETFFKQFNITTGIALFNNEIYIAGFDYAAKLNQANANNYTAVYWKNGTVVPISKAAQTMGISVDNNGVYVAGYRIKDNGEPYAATLWKNGVAEVLNGNDIYAAVDVAINQNDIYVTGLCSACKTALWKNGSPQKLDTDPNGVRKVLVVTR